MRRPGHLGMMYAEKGFLEAHKHYRKAGVLEATISECYKALESTLKVFCQRKEWSFSKRDTAGKLIQTVFKKGLILSELQSHFHSLKNTLLEGVPSIRNQFSGHGTVSTPRQVPAYLAEHDRICNRIIGRSSGKGICFAVSVGQEWRTESVIPVIQQRPLFFLEAGFADSDG